MTLLHQAAQKAVEAIDELLYSSSTDVARSKAATALAAIESALQHQEVPREPVDMLLFCPFCGLQHVDAPDERTPDWKNEPHKSHLCHGCGSIWRPADVPTNGVAELKTRGKADTWSLDDAAVPAIQQLAPDGFNGDTPNLVRSINAILSLDAAGAMAGPRLGGHARTLLTAAANRLAASPSTTRQQEVGSGWKLVPVVPTPEMIAAYLRANDAYWKQTDELPTPPNKWRAGTPSDATAESYRAMLAAAPSTPEKAGGVSDGVGAPREGQQL